MPTIRGTDAGSKKRYSGMVRVNQGSATTSGNKPTADYRLIFKGLESVRTDWSPLAREFQRELYRRIFLGEDYTDYLFSPSRLPSRQSPR